MRPVLSSSYSRVHLIAGLSPSNAYANAIQDARLRQIQKRYVLTRHARVRAQDRHSLKLNSAASYPGVQCP